MTRRSSRKARRAIADAAKNPQPAAPARSEPTPAPGPSRPSRSSAASGAARRGSARRGRRTAPREDGAASSGGSRKPTIDRDGKASIGCPSCGARYKIAEENLESKVTCTQCQRTFFPLAAANARHKPQDNTKPIIVGIVAVVAIIVVGMIINSATAPPPPPANTADETPKIDLRNAAEVADVIKWAKAIHNADQFNAEITTDIDAIQKKLGIETKNLYSRSFGKEQTALAKKVFTALFADDSTLIFRYYRPTGGRVMDESMIAKKMGRVHVNMYPTEKNPHKESGAVEIHYVVDSTSGRAKVTGWTVTEMARAEYLLEEIEGKNPTKKHVPHKIIGEVKRREISFGGKKEIITEAELTALPHLETTSPEDRKKIDALVSQLVDINLPGMAFNRACMELTKYGKASVPPVLTKMYEIKMKSQDDVLAVTRLTRYMRELTGERYGFNPSINTLGDRDVGASEKERISALKQWFAWWARYYDRDNWQNIDSDENVMLTTEEQAAKANAKAEADKKARDERRKRARGTGK